MEVSLSIVGEGCSSGLGQGVNTLATSEVTLALDDGQQSRVHKYKYDGTLKDAFYIIDLAAGIFFVKLQSKSCL